MKTIIDRITRVLMLVFTLGALLVCRGISKGQAPIWLAIVLVAVVLILQVFLARHEYWFWYPWGSYGMTRRRKKSARLPMGDWRWGGTYVLFQYDYRCRCGLPLEYGPRGGGSANAVCKPCGINYGCLPGFDE